MDERAAAGSLVPLAAFALDATLGDPPNAWHPVAWQGRLLAWAERHAPAAEQARFAWGIATLAGGAGLSAAAALAVDAAARRLPAIPRLLVQALVLKLALSAHGLDRATGEVEAALRRDDLPAARRLVSWHLVSRPTGDLSSQEVAAAAIESVAENLTDAFVAPLSAWAVAGPAGLWAYRFVQTADSMWGYHDSAHEWLGKAAARLDDALNWLPARLAAGLLALSAHCAGGDADNGLRTRRAQARRTSSPNAGQTMATMAGALHVTLSKRGHYSLEGGSEPATPAKIAQARDIVRLAAVLGLVLASVVVGLSRERK